MGRSGHRLPEQPLPLGCDTESHSSFLFFLVRAISWRGISCHSISSRKASCTYVLSFHVDLPISVYSRSIRQHGATTSMDGYQGSRDLVVFQTPFTGCSSMPGRHNLSLGSLPCEMSTRRLEERWFQGRTHIS